jgi:hypothetical protein
MKEALEMVIAFIKGLMQPLITVVGLGMGWFLVMTGKVSPDQAWLIPVGIIAYWFADKSGIWDKLFKGESPKVNTSTIGTSPKVEGWGDCDCDECTSNTPPVIPFAPATPEGSPKVEKVIDSIFEDLEADGIKPDVSAVSSRIVSWLGAHEGELTGAERAELIQAGINYASNAYVTVTGLQSVPKFYAEVADYNKWWRNNKAACKAPAGAAKAVLMTLRDLLGRRDGVA